jgi:hypothetical protein
VHKRKELVLNKITGSAVPGKKFEGLIIAFIWK